MNVVVVDSLIISCNESLSEKQLRDALARTAPGVFSSEELRRMTPAQMREELRKRAGGDGSGAPRGYTDAQLRKMGDEELRDVLRRAAPGEFSEEELRRMSRDSQASWSWTH